MKFFSFCIMVSRSRSGSRKERKESGEHRSLDHLDVIGREQAFPSLAGSLPPSLVVLLQDGDDITRLHAQFISFSGIVGIESTALRHLRLCRRGAAGTRAQWQKKKGKEKIKFGKAEKRAKSEE